MKAAIIDGDAVCGDCGSELQLKQFISTPLSGVAAFNPDTIFVRPLTGCEDIYEGTFCVACGKEADNVEVAQ